VVHEEMRLPSSGPTSDTFKKLGSTGPESGFFLVGY